MNFKTRNGMTLVWGRYRPWPRGYHPSIGQVGFSLGGYQPRMRAVLGGHVGHDGAGLGFGEGKDYLPRLLFTPHFLCFSFVFSPLEVRLRV